RLVYCVHAGFILMFTREIGKNHRRGGLHPPAAFLLFRHLKRSMHKHYGRMHSAPTVEPVPIPVSRSGRSITAWSIPSARGIFTVPSFKAKYAQTLRADAIRPYGRTGAHTGFALRSAQLLH